MPIIYVKNADFSNSGLGKYPTNPLNYQAETTAIIASGAISSLITGVNAPVYKEALNNFILRLKNGGVWNNFQILSIPWLCQNRTEAGFNFKTASSISTNLIYPVSSVIGTVNFGYRNPQTMGPAANQDEKLGIVIKNFTYDITNFHQALYHNNMGATKIGEYLHRDVSITPSGTTVANNNFFNLLATTTPSFDSRLGYNNDANRITLSGFDANFVSTTKKLVGLNTMLVNSTLTASGYTTGNNIGGQKVSVVPPANYFDTVNKTYIAYVTGETTTVKLNTCVLSLGTGLTDAQWAAYRAACDAMDTDLLGTIPTFPLY